MLGIMDDAADGSEDGGEGRDASQSKKDEEFLADHLLADHSLALADRFLLILFQQSMVSLSLCRTPAQPEWCARTGGSCAWHTLSDCVEGKISK
jgi:hypothetical protein